MKKVQTALLGAGIGCMLAFPQAVLMGATEGVSLWATRVLPALFPMLTCLLLLQSRLPLSPSISACLALLAGSPGSARLCASLPLPIRQKRFLAALTGTLSPMFLLSSLPAMMEGISGPWIALCHFAGALATAALFFPRKAASADAPIAPPVPLTLLQAVSQALNSMGAVLGIVVLCSVITALLPHALPRMPAEGHIFLRLLLEITSGVHALSQSNLPHRALLCVFFTSFSGLSILMQNAAFWQKGGVGLGRLCLYRFIHAVFSTLLYTVLFYRP